MDCSVLPLHNNSLIYQNTDYYVVGDVKRNLTVVFDMAK